MECEQMHTCADYACMLGYLHVSLVLKGVAVCCTGNRTMFQGVAVCCSALQCVVVCFRVLQYVAACCSALQYVAVC